MFRRDKRTVYQHIFDKTLWNMYNSIMPNELTYGPYDDLIDLTKTLNITVDVCMRMRYN